jgi:hypothetical protein
LAILMEPALARMDDRQAATLPIRCLKRLYPKVLGDALLPGVRQ